MADIARVAIPMNIRGPFKLGGIRVPCPYVARLELFELLLGAEFIGLDGSCQS